MSCLTWMSQYFKLSIFHIKRILLIFRFQTTRFEDHYFSKRSELALIS